MAGIFDKLKDAAKKAGQAGMKDPRVMRRAVKVKEAVDAFKEGYREQLDPEKHKLVCPHCGSDLPREAKFCAQCGARVD